MEQVQGVGHGTGCAWCVGDSASCVSASMGVWHAAVAKGLSVSGEHRPLRMPPCLQAFMAISCGGKTPTTHLLHTGVCQ